MPDIAPRVVVVDHYDSYTWNLVHLIAAVTGTLPTVVQHDTATAAYVLGFDYAVLSPARGIRRIPVTSPSEAPCYAQARSRCWASASACRAS
ncbi:MAG: hypothetical protein M3306_02335 [Actinomycetota bacterium]|nr:hypothetical protein [Actinomycetota bacterium]